MVHCKRFENFCEMNSKKQNFNSQPGRSKKFKGSLINNQIYIILLGTNIIESSNENVDLIKVCLLFTCNLSSYVRILINTGEIVKIGNFFE